MTKKLSLTLAAILTGTFLASAAQAQNKDFIILQKDVLDLQGYVKDVQRSMDAMDLRNKSLQALIEQVVDKVNLMGGEIQTGVRATVESGVKSNSQATQANTDRLAGLLGEIKAQNDRGAAASAAAMTAINTSIDKIAGDLSGKIDQTNANIDRMGPQIAKTAEQIAQLDDKSTKSAQSITQSNEKLVREIAELKLQLGALSDQLSRHAADTGKVPMRSPEETLSKCGGEAFQSYYADALDCYQDFLSKFPDHSLASRAELGKGDAAYSQGKWEQAEISYDLVLQNYRVPDTKRIALYKKGLAQEKQGKKAEAIKTLTEYKELYPGTIEAINATDLLKQLQPPTPAPAPARGGATTSRG